jgi:hypothetical protein
MALPFDVNLTINVLREICLSSTIELASLRTNTDGTKYGNLNDASIFGRVYEPQSSSNKIDINSNFPLLANIPMGSPPIKFEEDVLSRTHSHDNSLNGSVIESISSLENESDASIENTRYNTTKPLLDDSTSTISRSTSIGVQQQQQQQQRVPSNRMHVSKPSIHESIAEVESLISLPMKPESTQLITPVRPEIGSRSISANTIKSRQDTPTHNQQHLLQPPQLFQANTTTTTTTTNSHKKSSSLGSKKQSKGLLALGRLIRPKQLANTLVHHNSTPGSSPYVSDTDSNRSDSLLVRGQQQSNVSGKIVSYSENNLVENLELNHINNQKRIIDSRSIDSDKYLSTNSERDTIDSDFNGQEEDKKISNRYEEVYSDNDNDDYDDDAVNDEDGYDNSEVDSIESSDLADSDYDYFNPPAISTDDNALINRLNGLSKVTSLITSDTDYGASPHSRRNKYAYSEYEDPEYIDEMDSDDYISDAEDYTMPDSINYYDEGTGESSIIAPTSIIEVEQDKPERVNSISKISFIKNRPNGRNVGVNINSANISKSLFGQKRRQSAGSNGVRPHANSLMMSDIVNTSETIPSTLSVSMMHSKNGYSLNKRYKSGKSFSNMRSLALETKEKEKEKDFIIFSKIVPSLQKSGPVSKLTELIHKTNISLDYYKYVSEKQNISDELVNVTICVPKLNIFYDTALKLQINYNVKVVELIGYVLYTVEDKIRKNDNEELKNPNSWKLYLADDDGEIEDDFGVLDRNRNVQSYGADEFVIVECTNEERKINEKITPSPLENGGNINIGNEKFEHILDSIKEFPMIREESINTLPSDLTPTSGINFNNTLPSNNFRQRRPVPQSISSIQERRFVIDALDSDDDDNNTNINANNKDSTKNKLIQKNNQNPFLNVGKDIKNYTYLKGKLNSSNIYDKTEKEKESKLNKFKTRSKTIQSILHNTADHYQLTQQELFRTTGNNIEIANNALNNSISSEEIKNKNKNKTLGYRLQQNLHNNVVHSGLDEEGDNKALMYHSWTVWRRQQMSFKNKLPKTLTVDGYQIYLLPFNEFKGSWYDSKTYNFDISQILKIKQNIKVPNNFKIIIKKNTEGIVKKYYLEAQSARECKEIVNTIRALAKTYSEQR